MEHMVQGHYFYRLRPEMLPLPRQWCEPDHRLASGFFSYEAYRYLLDLQRLEDVSLLFFAFFSAEDYRSCWLLTQFLLVC